MTTSGARRRTAYLRPATIADWSRSRFARWAARVADCGVTGIVTKLPAITDEVAHACARAGLSLTGAFSCYSAQGADPAPSGAAALDDHGRPLEPVEWYSGLVPGDPALEDARAESFDQELRRGVVDTVILDFLRWPGHWETESRGRARPRPCSFDPDTLGRFLGWAETAGVDAPGLDPRHPASSARSLLGPLRPAWVSFRAQTVTRFAARLADIAHHRGVDVGAFLVPLPNELRIRDYGQDVTGLARHLDQFVPMTYHSMAAKPAGWIRRRAQEVATRTGKPVVAMVQLTSAHEYSGGWDWGESVDPAELTATLIQLDHDIDHNRLAGYCYFPGEAHPLAPAENPANRPVSHPAGQATIQVKDTAP